MRGQAWLWVVLRAELLWAAVTYFLTPFTYSRSNTEESNFSIDIFFAVKKVNSSYLRGDPDLCVLAEGRPFINVESFAVFGRESESHSTDS